MRSLCGFIILNFREIATLSVNLEMMHKNHIAPKIKSNPLTD